VSNPIIEYFKYAEKKKVHVREHVRRTAHGTTVVDAHDRTDEEGDIDDVLITSDIVAPTKAAPVEFDEDAEADTPIESAEEAPLKRRVSLEKVEKRSVGPLTKEQELELWKKWKSGGKKPSDLEPLLQSFKPLLAEKMKAYKGRVKLIPDAAIEAEFQMRFVEALDTFDPDKASLSTYVFRYLDKAKRFIAENQNVGRIPETRVYQIKKYQTAVADLNEELSRPPTPTEISKKLGWPVAEVERMDSELRNDLLSQGFEDDPYALTPSKSEEVLRLFKYELAGQERAVYEYLTGYGKPRLESTGDIAKKLNLQDYQVSRYKDSIQKKLRKYLEE